MKTSISFLLLVLTLSKVGFSQVEINAVTPHYLNVKSTTGAADNSWGVFGTNTNSSTGILFKKGISNTPNWQSTGSNTGVIQYNNTLQFGLQIASYDRDLGLYGIRALKLGTNANSERMIITSNGNVGINNNAPLSKLHIIGTGNQLSSWNTYARPLKASVLINGTHSTFNDPYDAVGLAVYSNGAKDCIDQDCFDHRQNVGIVSAVGNSGSQNKAIVALAENQGGEAWMNQGVSALASGKYLVYGVSGSAQGVDNSLANVYGVSGSASGSGTKYGISGHAYGSGTKYGVYGSTSNETGVRYAGYFSGNVYTTGSYLPSDESLKSDVKMIDSALEKIMKLSPSTYHYKTEEFKKENLLEGERFGFTAQDIQRIFPQLVKEAELHSENEDSQKKVTFLAVNYTELIPILTKAIQEQQAVIEELRKKIGL